MRAKLGAFTCPSGNSCDVYFARDHRGLEHVFYEWDREPPLRPEDELYYLAVIVPQTTRLIVEYTERPARRALYIRC